MSALRVALFALVLSLLAAVAPRVAHAHVMAAQRGTVNVTPRGAFVAISIPTSGLVGVDDDGDHLLSARELSRHRAAIRGQFDAHVQLWIDGSAAAFEPLLLELSPPDDAPMGPASQLLVMGRFVLRGEGSALHFTMALFGDAPSEQRAELSFSRGGRSQTLSFSPSETERALFGATARAVSRAASRPASRGSDHLLFALLALGFAGCSRFGRSRAGRNAATL